MIRADVLRVLALLSCIWRVALDVPGRQNELGSFHD